MPRSTSPTLESLLPACETQSTAEITLRDDSVKRFCTGDEPLELGSNTYLPDLIRVGELKETLGQPTNRVTVKVANVRNDSELGAYIADPSRKTELADVVIKRLYVDSSNPAVFEWKHFFTGKAVNVVAEQELIEQGEAQVMRPFVSLDVIPDTTAAGTCIATETLTPNNGWKFPETPDQSAPGTGDNPGGGIGGGTCFTGDTLINIGDSVSIDFASAYAQRERLVGGSIKSFDDAGNIVADIIERFFRHRVYEYLKVVFEDEMELHVTAEHPLFTPAKRFIPAGELRVGDCVLEHYGGQWYPLEIVSIEAVKAPDGIDVFNLETRTYHHYFVEGKGAHNSKDPNDL